MQGLRELSKRLGLKTLLPNRPKVFLRSFEILGLGGFRVWELGLRELGFAKGLVGVEVFFLGGGGGGGRLGF